jgi:hypothetical protein
MKDPVPVDEHIVSDLRRLTFEQLTRLTEGFFDGNVPIPFELLAVREERARIEGLAYLRESLKEMLKWTWMNYGKTLAIAQRQESLSATITEGLNLSLTLGIRAISPWPIGGNNFSRIGSYGLYFTAPLLKTSTISTGKGVTTVSLISGPVQSPVMPGIDDPNLISCIPPIRVSRSAREAFVLGSTSMGGATSLVTLRRN